MIGDVLTSSILCEALKERFTDSEIHYLINLHTIPVIEGNPNIDLFKVYTPEIEKSKKLKKSFRKQLKQEKYDIVIDVYSTLGSVKIARATKAPLIIGYKKWYTKRAYTNVLSYHFHSKTDAGIAIENRMKLLQIIDTSFPLSRKPKIYLSPEEIGIAQEQLQINNVDKNKPLFMISVLGSSPEKSYPLPYLATVLDHIVIETEAQLLLNYIPSQRNSVDKLLRLCSINTRSHIIDQLYGKSLRSFIALTSQCDAIIGNEGGAINMAKAINIPTFAIFSPWIRKEAWSLYENEDNIAIHLSKYHPEFYSKRKPKKLKKKVDYYYKFLKPSLFTSDLNNFFKTLKSKKVL